MAPKRFFTKNNERVGKKSGKPRGKYKKHGQQPTEAISLPQIAEEIKAAKHESPSIYRKITEHAGKWKLVGLLAYFLVIVGLSGWQGTLAVEKLGNLQKVVAQRLILTQQMNLWEGIAQKYPTYRDAYFQAAVLAYQLKETEKEKQYLSKALELDPNYVPAQNLEKLQ